MDNEELNKYLKEQNVQLAKYIEDKLAKAKNSLKEYEIKKFNETLKSLMIKTQEQEDLLIDNFKKRMKEIEKEICHQKIKDSKKEYARINFESGMSEIKTMVHNFIVSF